VRPFLARGPEFLRYVAGSGVMLALKLALMQLAVRLLAAVPAYALVQVAIFFASYAWHCRFTFGARFSRAGLGRFLRTMVVFQALDWLLFSVIYTRFGLDSNLVILLSTAVVFVVRFVFVRRSLQADRS
jgi:putative flippase GtrA